MFHNFLFLIENEKFSDIPVRLWNRLLSAWLEQVLSRTEKSCIASNYRKFSKNKIFFRIYFPVWLRNLRLSAGLELVLSKTEKSCIASNYRKFSTNIKMKSYKIKTSFVTPIFILWFLFQSRRKFSVIRCYTWFLSLAEKRF